MKGGLETAVPNMGQLKVGAQAGRRGRSREESKDGKLKHNLSAQIKSLVSDCCGFPFLLCVLKFRNVLSLAKSQKTALKKRAAKCFKHHYKLKKSKA